MAQGQGEPSGQLVVAFRTDGFDVVKTAIAGVDTGLNELARQANQFGSQFERTAALIGQQMGRAMNQEAVRRSAEGLAVVQDALGGLGTSMEDLDARARSAGRSAGFGELAARGLAELDRGAKVTAGDLGELADLLSSLGPAGRAAAGQLSAVSAGLGAAARQIAEAAGAAGGERSAEGLDVLRGAVAGLGVSLEDLDRQAQGTGRAFSFSELAAKGLAQLDDAAGGARDELAALLSLLQGLGPAGQAAADRLAQVGAGLGGLGRQIAAALGSAGGAQGAQGLGVLQQSLAGLGASMQQLNRAAGQASGGTATFATLAARGLAQLGQPVNAVRSSLAQLLSALASLGPAGGRLAAQLQQAAGGVVQSSPGVLALTQNLSGLQRAGFAAGQGLSGMYQALQGSAQALQPVVGYLHGFVTAGIAASSAGQVLSVQTEELSRQIASVFAPTIYAVSGGLESLIGWFRNLSGEQQATLRQWGLFAFGLTSAAAILPRVIASVQGLVTVAGGLRVALVALSAHPLVAVATLLAAAVVSTMDFESALKGLADTGLSAAQGLGAVFGDLVTIIQGVGTAAKEAAGVMAEMIGLGKDLDIGKTTQQTHKQARDAVSPMRAAAERAGVPGQYLPAAQSLLTLWAMFTPGMSPLLATGPGAGMIFPDKDGKKKDRHELEPRLGGFESLEATYRRISMAAIRATSGVKGPQEELNETMAEILSNVKKLVEKAEGLPPDRLP